MPKTISVKRRNIKQSLSTLRNKEIIPGILYGPSLKESIPIQLPLKDLQSIIQTTATTTIFPLELEGETCNCILREFQPDMLYSQILHVDFQVVKSGEVVKMNIPMSYDGLEHLKGKKLILEKAIDKIPVKGPVNNLPEAFKLEVGTLERGAKIFARSISLPEKTDLLLNPETIIATVQ
ncbi:MAG: 50S ribosomal protein L25 [Cellulosilyticaceae bacterium]